MDIRDKVSANEDRVIKGLLRMSTPRRSYWVLLPPAALVVLLLWLLVGLINVTSRGIDAFGDAVSRNNREASACVDAGGDPVMANFGLKYIGCRRPK